MIETDKYIGTYRVLSPVDSDGRVTTNLNDTYLSCKYRTEIFRYDKHTLAVYFVSNQTVNNVLPKLKEMGVKLTLFAEGDFESVYHFSEGDLQKVVSILKPMTQGKNIKPTSVRTVRRLLK